MAYYKDFDLGIAQKIIEEHPFNFDVIRKIFKDRKVRIRIRAAYKDRSFSPRFSGHLSYVKFICFQADHRLNVLIKPDVTKLCEKVYEALLIYHLESVSGNRYRPDDPELLQYAKEYVKKHIPPELIFSDTVVLEMCRDDNFFNQKVREDTIPFISRVK